MEIKTKATRYSRAFKEGVCKEYLLGLYSKRGLEEKYKLGNGRVRGWLIELNLFKQEITTLDVVKPLKPNIPKGTQQELEDVKKELEDVKLQLEAYKLMIDLAEQEFKINIKKKSNTK